MITVNGIQRVLGTGFHFIEAKNFTFDGKKFLARTNLIQHGNMARVFVPRGCVFTAVVDQQPIVLPHRVQPYLFNTPRFQTPAGRTVSQCFVKIGSQDIEHMSVRIFLVRHTLYYSLLRLITNPTLEHRYPKDIVCSASTEVILSCSSTIRCPTSLMILCSNGVRKIS